MSGRTFAIVAVLGLLLAAICLALASALGSPLLAVVGAVFVAVVLAAREDWLWRGNVRGWVATMGALAALAVAAYLISVSA